MNRMPADPARRHRLLTELCWLVYEVASGPPHTTPTQRIAQEHKAMSTNTIETSDE
jgi:hypothetical protein